MTEQLKKLFVNNIELIDMTDKAVLAFREQNYLTALEYMPKISEGMRNILDVIISNREYFELVSADSLIEMLEGIFEASKCVDYVLLADLLELQLSTLLCNVQELIMKKEEILCFDEELYRVQCDCMKTAMERALNAESAERLFAKPLEPEKLLEKGYRVEFTSCGLRTVAVGTEKGAIYLHSNHKALLEAHMLARNWMEKGTQAYLVQGFGMGYHIKELANLAKGARIEVYESDAQVLKLACAFAPVKELLEDKRISIVYDKNGIKWEERKSALTDNEKICNHMPSLMASKNGNL